MLSCFFNFLDMLGWGAFHLILLCPCACVGLARFFWPPNEWSCMTSGFQGYCAFVCLPFFPHANAHGCLFCCFIASLFWIPWDQMRPKFYPAATSPFTTSPSLFFPLFLYSSDWILCFCLIMLLQVNSLGFITVFEERGGNFY